jgi:hypothetical protein
MIEPRQHWVIHHMDQYLAGTIAELALTSNRGPLKPLYVRMTDAEIAIEERHESIAGPNT